MNFTEKTLNKNYVYKGKIISVRCDDAVLPNGKPCKREIVEHSGGACVLCVLENKAVLVRQYRYAYESELLELPAGKIDPGEDPALCAARELSEETGLEAERLRLMHVLYPTPGYTNEKIYIYLAEGVTAGKAHLDEGEFLNVVFLPLEEAYRMAESGELHDGKTLVALLHYKLLQAEK